jgi:hypothetical protein
LTSNEKRRHALLGRPRTIEERAKIRTGMLGLSQDDPDWERQYQQNLKHIRREEKIKVGLQNAVDPLIAPEVENRRTQLGQLIRDSTTTVSAEYLDREKLLELIEKRYITDETWRQLEEWLDGNQDTEDDDPSPT